MDNKKLLVRVDGATLTVIFSVYLAKGSRRQRSLILPPVAEPQSELTNSCLSGLDKSLNDYHNTKIIYIETQHR